MSCLHFGELPAHIALTAQPVPSDGRLLASELPEPALLYLGPLGESLA